ncbi:MAG: MOSC domain-containing protein, partial [Pseudomonadota bacterium]
MLDTNTTRLDSINAGEIGHVRFGGETLETGIVKRPMVGAVPITVHGVGGDEIADPRYHGGPDQAVYAYSLGDYDWW